MKELAQDIWDAASDAGTSGMFEAAEVAVAVLRWIALEGFWLERNGTAEYVTHQFDAEVLAATIEDLSTQAARISFNREERSE